ncbi:MAG: hypothetical protein PHH82_04770 [Candidatus ainarchaeum sp.]|nr:hypothetical protein [Candidatus ainarchaeum sp.]
MRKINKNSFWLWGGIAVAVLFWLFIAIQAGIQSGKHWHFIKRTVTVDTLITKDSIIIPVSMKEILLGYPILSTEGVLLHFKVEKTEINFVRNEQNIYVNGLLIMSEEKEVITDFVKQVLEKSSDKSCFFVTKGISQGEEKEWIDFLIDNGVRQILIPRVLLEQNDKQIS